MPRLSSFELKRRLTQHDTDAERIAVHDRAVPLLRGAATVTTVVISTFIAFSIVSLIANRFFAVFVIVLTLLVVEVIAMRLRPLVSRLQTKYEHQLSERLVRQKWLQWFAASDDDVVHTPDSQEELLHIIQTSQLLTPAKKSQLSQVLTYDAKLIRDVMTPKGMIRSIDVNESIGPLVIDELHKSGHSRFPVVGEDIDHIVGMLYLRDLVTLKKSHGTVKDAMDERVYYVKDNQMLSHALQAFLRTHHHLFIVVNSYRETVGILSLEDVIEAMLGITVIDEFDEFNDLRKVAEHNPHALNEPKKKVDI